MADSGNDQDKPKHPTEKIELSEPTRSLKPSAYRERFGASMLCQIRGLPQALYAEVVRRFLYGDAAKNVAQWLYGLPKEQ